MLFRSAVVSVSAASFSGAELASEAIIAAFGTALANATQAATTQPLPTELAGTRVTVRDSQNVERAAPLFFAAPSQVNYQLPAGTANGWATVTITNGDGTVARGTQLDQAPVQIVDIHEGLNNTLMILRGKEQMPMPKLHVGDIGVVAKLNNTKTGDTFSPKDKQNRVTVPEFPAPLYTVAVMPRTQADGTKNQERRSMTHQSVVSVGAAATSSGFVHRIG